MPNSKEPKLDESRPEFLDRLDTDRESAFAAFYEFTRALLRTQPPRLLRALPHDERDDFLHDLVHHCCRNGFRVLRQYVDRGAPFARWLKCVANRKIVDRLRRNTRASLAGTSLDVVPEHALAKDRRPELASRWALRSVLDHLANMPFDKQILVLARASGMAPSVLCSLLDMDNKRISDHWRYAVLQLKQKARR